MKRWQVLESLVAAHGWSRGAEIGVFTGKTFFHLLWTFPHIDLIGVDQWKGDTEPHDQDKERGVSTSHTQEEMDSYATDVKTRAEKYRNAKVLHMPSEEAAKVCDDGSLDFVFIDADHSTEGVLADVRRWAPKVREGGWILGHDEQWPSVRRALTQAFNKWSVHPDNVWSVP